MDDFRQLANRLKRRFSGVRVSVRRGEVGNGEFATTSLDDESGHFLIIVDKSIDVHFACFLLVHEWPHCVSWHVDKKEHGPAFWKAMRQSYDVYVKWCAE
jgi:hypothetical protein